MRSSSSTVTLPATPTVATSAVVQKSPGSSSSSFPVGVPQASSAHSLLVTPEPSAVSKLESKVSSMKKELEAMRSAKQRNDGGRTSGEGFSKPLGTSVLGGGASTDLKKKVTTTTKVKQVPAGAPALALAPKVNSSLPASTASVSIGGRKYQNQSKPGNAAKVGVKVGIAKGAGSKTSSKLDKAVVSSSGVAGQLSQSSVKEVQFIQDLLKQQRQQQQRQQQQPLPLPPPLKYLPPAVVRIYW